MNARDPMKPVGVWEVRRRINIPALVHAADAMSVEHAVSALSGVRRVATDMDKNQIVVRYDASETAYQAIVEILVSIGFPPLDNWWGRFKGDWFQFTDINARDNANAPPSACCGGAPRGDAQLPAMCVGCHKLDASGTRNRDESFADGKHSPAQ